MNRLRLGTALHLRSARALPWLGFLLLSALFFLTYHDPSRVQVDGYNQAQQDIVTTVETGSPVREGSWLALGAWAVWSLLKYPRNRRLVAEGALGPVLLGFLVWSFLSCAWADDLALTAKRLVSFGLLCLVAVAVVKRFSLRRIVLGTLVCTVQYLLFEIAAELAHGTLHPLSGGWRFGGMQHPNSEGMELAPLVLSGLAAARLYPERRKWLYGITAVGFLWLLLTGSRTALLSTLLAVAVYTVAVSSRRTKAVLLPGAGIVVFAVLALIGAGAATGLQKTLLLGREDVSSEELTSFTGRTIIWQDVSPYIQQSPILGHGYSGFWTTEHISDISDEEKWGVPNSHSTYVDYVLTLGIVGAVLYSTGLLLGLGRAVRMCRIEGDASLAFACGLLVFSIIDGLMESGMGEGELGTLLCAIVLAWLASVPLHQVWKLRVARQREAKECVA